MAINFNDNLRILAAKPIDSRYYDTNGTPYGSTAGALSAIPLTYRYIGLTVNVNQVEYWFANDLLTLTPKGGGGNVTIDPSIQLNGTSYGSYNDGDTIAQGTTIQEVFENMFRVSVPPTYTLPTLTFSPDDTNIESGSYFNFDLLTTFTQNDAGDASTFVIIKSYDGVLDQIIYNGLPVADVSDYSLDQVLDGGDLIYNVTVEYKTGPIKNDNLGNPVPGGQILDGSLNIVSTITGVRAYFYDDTTDTVAPTSSADIRALSGKGLNPQNGTTFTINIAAGTTRVVFAYPDTLQAVSSVKYVELGNGEVKDTFSLSTVNVEGLNGFTGVDYKVYTYLPAIPYGDNATYNVTI